MSTPPTPSELEQTLRERDIEILQLNAQLASLKAGIPPAPGTQTDFLRQLQHLFAGVVVADLAGRLTWANTGYLAWSGRPLADLVGRPLAELAADEPTQAAIAPVIERGLRRQELLEFDIPDASPAHAGGWLRVRVQPIRNPAGQVERFVGVLADITKKKKFQQEIVDREAEFRALAAQVPCVLYRVRQNKAGGRELLYCSPRLKELFGLDDLHELRQYVHPDDNAQFLAAIAEAAATNASVSVAFRLAVPGQPLRWCKASSMLTGCDAAGVVHSGSLEDITLQWKAEEAARQNELRALLVREGLGISRWEYQYNTKRVILSEEGRDSLGYADQPWPESCQALLPYVHPDDLPALLTAWDKYHGGETSIFACEHRLRCHDGSYRWMLNRGMVTKYDAQGIPLVFTGFLGDIHARKLSQQAQTTTAVRLTTTIKKLKRGVLLVDEDRKIVLTNASFCQLFGLGQEPEELIGADYATIEAQVRASVQGPLDEVPLPDMPELVARRQEVRHHLLRLRNGRVLERDFVPVDEHGTDIGFLWKFEDITDSYLAETTLRLREEKYRTIIDNMQLGLVETDLDHRVLYANPNYCDIIGYTNEELIGRPLPPRLLPPQSVAHVDQQLRQRAQGISNSYEVAIVTKSGETRWLFSGAAPLYNHEHRIAGSIGISLDITQQKQMEQRLREAIEHAEQSTKAKEQFLANMSHEIRTPMNAILGMSQLLAKTPLAPRQSNYLHAISMSAQNLLVIINDILDLTKLDSGKMTLERVGFNVNRLCEQVKKTLFYKAEEKGLALTVKVNPLVPDVVLGDPYRITQILLNLASNAVKFTEKGEVSIECEVVLFSETMVELGFMVRDTGVGIAPDYLKQIFQEFSQEDASITRQYGGTGLGLSISRSLARLMGSEIVIESVKNQGTDIFFALELPTGTVADLPPRSPVSSANLQELRGKHVLLVEDNEYNRLMAKVFLLNSHLKVTEAENGQEALDLAGQQAFDLILMDVQMPVMDGFEATRYLRQDLGLTIPIIALTASAISGEKERCLAAGMDAYLTKPFYEDELLQLLCDWLLQPAAPLLAPPAGAAPAAPPAPGAPPLLYNLDVLQSMARGDEKFVSSMLQTFIDSTQRTLQDLHAALAVGNLAGLQAAAHKLRPSLRHLQIQAALRLMDLLEDWPGAFSYDDLQPPVEAADRILRQVLTEMTAEQEKRRAAGY